MLLHLTASLDRQRCLLSPSQCYSVSCLLVAPMNHRDVHLNPALLTNITQKAHTEVLGWQSSPCAGGMGLTETSSTGPYVNGTQRGLGGSLWALDS